MKITLYTVETCKFSAEEREYLKSKNLPFEEKDVEKDHAALEVMLKIGNNFAGTPVTEIVKDDASTVVLKGFTREEFEKELAPPAPATDKPADETKPADSNAPPADLNAPAVVPPPAGVAPADPSVPAPNPLDSILQDLQSKIPLPTLDNPPAPAVPTVAPPTPIEPPQSPPAPGLPPAGAPVGPGAPIAPGLPNVPGQQQ